MKSSEYNQGYNKARSELKHLENKYAQMWCEANIWKVPTKLHIPKRPESPERMFISGAWAVLEQLHKDGVISEIALDKHWKSVTNTNSEEKLG